MAENGGWHTVIVDVIGSNNVFSYQKIHCRVDRGHQKKCYADIDPALIEPPETVIFVLFSSADPGIQCDKDGTDKRDGEEKYADTAINRHEGDSREPWDNNEEYVKDNAAHNKTSIVLAKPREYWDE